MRFRSSCHRRPGRFFVAPVAAAKLQAGFSVACRRCIKWPEKIMEQLEKTVHGQRQTHYSLRPYMLEEAYEAIAAIEVETGFA